MPLLLAQGNSVIYSLPLTVLSWFYRCYLTCAGCLLSSLKGPRLTGHFQVLKDISDACARWHWMLFPVGGTSAGCWKIPLILILVCVEEMRKLCVSPAHIKCMMFSSKRTHLYWENPAKPDLVWKSLGSASPIQTHFWGPQLKCLFLWLLLSGVRFQKKESNFLLTL